MVRTLLLLITLLVLSACQINELSVPDFAKKDLKSEYNDAMQAYAEQDWNKAEQALRILTKENSSDPQVWFKLANIYARDNRTDDAIRLYQEALIRDPENPKIWHNLGVVQLRQASLSFFRVTQFAKEDNPLFNRASSILNLYDQAQTAGNQ